MPALDFVGASNENPDSQSVNLQVERDARVEISNERLISAKLETGEDGTTSLNISVTTNGVEGSEEGVEFSEKVIVTGSGEYVIPIQIIIFKSFPRECRGRRTTVQYMTRGSFDNFVGLEATIPSPYLVSTGLLQRQYDDPGTNKRLFGDSFRLGSCRVCGARVYVRARSEGELFDNDTLAFGVSDAANGINYNPVTVAPVFSPMWTGQPSPFTFYREIGGSVLNPEINAKNAAMLDISSQDDTAIDWIRVYIWRY
ncbi:MAG: hypothetical protein ABWZ66_02200 [Pyrinomonadaceae bacterium]